MPLLSLLFRKRGRPQAQYAMRERVPGVLGSAQEAGMRYVEIMRGEKMEEEGKRRLHEKMSGEEAEKLREMLKKFGFEPENIHDHVEKLRTLKSLYEAGLRRKDLWGAVNYAREQLGIEETSNEKMREIIRKIIYDQSIAPFLG